MTAHIAPLRKRGMPPPSIRQLALPRLMRGENAYTVWKDISRFRSAGLRYLVDLQQEHARAATNPAPAQLPIQTDPQSPGPGEGDAATMRMVSPVASPDLSAANERVT